MSNDPPPWADNTASRPTCSTCGVPVDEGQTRCPECRRAPHEAPGTSGAAPAGSEALPDPPSEAAAAPLFPGTGERSLLFPPTAQIRRASPAEGAPTTPRTGGPRRLVESAVDAGSAGDTTDPPWGGAKPVSPPASAPRGAPPPGAAPPPLHPPAPSAQQTADHGLIVGVVNGSVSMDSLHHRFWGVKALVALALVGLFLVLAGGLDDGARAGASLLSVLVAPLLLLVCFGLIFSVVLGIGAGRYFGGLRRACGAVVRTVTRTLTRGISAGARGSVGALRSAPTSEHAVTVRRFRVQSITGQIVACVLVGELVGDEVRHGDVVRFTARSTRHGHYEPRRIDVLSSPVGPIVSTVTVRPSTRFLIALWGDRVAKVLAAIIALGVVVSVWQALM